jgi:tripartite-type tricarboxylate transporter receptor subunit TctC
MSSRCLVVALTLGCSAQALAQSSPNPTDYPNRPVRIIVGLAAGGAIDTIARSMSGVLASRLGQPVIVENRPGAGEAIGSELTARATPDGYTVFMASAAVVVNPLLNKVRYDPIKDLAPITQITRQPYVMVVHPSVPAQSAKELLPWIKANPGKVNYASSGSGSLMHLTGEMFKSAAGVTMTHVPYKGMALAYPDLIAGQVQVGFPAIITALPHLKSGKLRALGVTGTTRVASLPGVPTLIESGVPGFVVEQWYGLYAPAGTPSAIIARLHKEFTAVVKDPDTVARMTATGSEAVGNSTAEFAAHVRAESQRWGKIIREAGIKLQ